MNKRIIFVFLGSEVRSIDAFEQQMRTLGVIDEYLPFIDGMRMLGEEPIAFKLQRIRAAERYADMILSQPGCAQLQTRPYMRASVPLDLSRYKYSIPGREIPLIVHAPTSPLTKGTPYIVQVIERLRNEGVQFEFKLIENMPNNELRDLLTSADIVVDELYADTVGVLSAEGMATGNAVLTHYPAEFAGVPGDCPAINVTEDTLYASLRQAILNLPWRKELAEKGRRYVEQYNAHIRIAGDIIKWIQPGGIVEYDFVPDFFKQVNQNISQYKHPLK